MGDAPPITGFSPLYLFRQLHSVQTGARGGPSAADSARDARHDRTGFLTRSRSPASLEDRSNEVLRSPWSETSSWAWYLIR